jgi:ubiquinone/menaquinone biosynthesis C-methylase UbiE
MEPNREHIKLNQRKWDARAATFDQKRYAYFRWLQRKVIRLVDLKPGIRFLDIGCGTGWAVCYVARLLRDEGEFLGIDISDKMIEKARASSKGFENVHFYITNAEQIPIQSSSMDCAICTNSFHHYLDPYKVITEIGRVLRVGGHLLILDATTDDFFMRWVDRRVRGGEPEHVKFYSSREYRSMFEAGGLKAQNSKWVTYPLKAHMAEKSSPVENDSNENQ